jgi:hypothetical protein
MHFCLKVGDKYTANDVNRLKKHIPDIMCLTDDPTGLNTSYITLPDLPLHGVWWKMYFFHYNFPSGIFFDLDIDIKKPINNVFNPKDKMTLLKTDWEDLEELNKNTIGDRYKYCSINSSVMAWNTCTHHIWRDFYDNHEKIMSLFNGIDTYLEHRQMHNLSFFDTGLVGSYRCNPDADVYIMSYDGEGKNAFNNNHE